MNRRQYTFLKLLLGLTILIWMQSGCGGKSKDSSRITPTGTSTIGTGTTGTGTTGTGTTGTGTTGTGTTGTGTTGTGTTGTGTTGTGTTGTGTTGTGTTGTGTSGTGTATIPTGDATAPCATGQYASGFVWNNYKYDGEIVQYGLQGRYGFAKINLTGISSSKTVQWATIRFKVITPILESRIYFSNVDPQSEATDLDLGKILLGKPCYFTGTMVFDLPIEGINALNTAITSAQGFITALWIAC